MCRYGNQETVEIPDNITILYNAPDREPRTSVSIDKCLVEEIKNLWSKGIHTSGCCCGHGKQNGSIGVITEDIPKMKALGYEKHLNPNYPESEKFFIPKTEAIKQVENIEDHLAFSCQCGSVGFNLLKSGSTECTLCGKRGFQWADISQEIKDKQ